MKHKRLKIAAAAVLAAIVVMLVTEYREARSNIDTVMPGDDAFAAMRDPSAKRTIDAPLEYPGSPWESKKTFQA